MGSGGNSVGEEVAGGLFFLFFLKVCAVKENGISESMLWCLIHMQGDEIYFKVNKLNSVKNLPFEYYSLPYCKPDKIISSAENLGEVLRGDRIENSPFKVSRVILQEVWTMFLPLLIPRTNVSIRSCFDCRLISSQMKVATFCVAYQLCPKMKPKHSNPASKTTTK